MSDDDVWQHMADMAGEDYQRELITEQVAALTAAIARVRALHVPGIQESPRECDHCYDPFADEPFRHAEWPYDTIRALDGTR